MSMAWVRAVLLSCFLPLAASGACESSILEADGLAADEISVQFLQTGALQLKFLHRPPAAEKDSSDEIQDAYDPSMDLDEDDYPGDAEMDADSEMDVDSQTQEPSVDQAVDSTELEGGRVTRNAPALIEASDPPQLIAAALLAADEKKADEKKAIADSFKAALQGPKGIHMTDLASAKRLRAPTAKEAEANAELDKELKKQMAEKRKAEIAQAAADKALEEQLQAEHQKAFDEAFAKGEAEKAANAEAEADRERIDKETAMREWAEKTWAERAAAKKLLDAEEAEKQAAREAAEKDAGESVLKEEAFNVDTEQQAATMAAEERQKAVEAAADKKAAEKLAAEKRQAQKAAVEKAAAQQAAAEKAKEEAEELRAEKEQAETEAIEKEAAEKEAAAKLAMARAQQYKEASQKDGAERLALEKAIAEEALAEDKAEKEWAEKAFEKADNTACGWLEDDYSCQWDNQAFVNGGSRYKPDAPRAKAVEVCGHICEDAGDECGGFTWKQDSCYFRKNVTCGRSSQADHDCYIKRATDQNAVEHEEEDKKESRVQYVSFKAQTAPCDHLDYGCYIKVAERRYGTQEEDPWQVSHDLEASKKEGSGNTTREVFFKADDADCGYWEIDDGCGLDNLAHVDDGLSTSETVSREGALVVCGDICDRAGDKCGGFAWKDNKCHFRTNAKCGVINMHGADCYVKHVVFVTEGNPIEESDSSSPGTVHPLHVITAASQQQETAPQSDEPQSKADDADSDSSSTKAESDKEVKDDGDSDSSSTKAESDKEVKEAHSSEGLLKELANESSSQEDGKENNPVKYITPEDAAEGVASESLAETDDKEAQLLLDFQRRLEAERLQER